MSRRIATVDWGKGNDLVTFASGKIEDGIIYVEEIEQGEKNTLEDSMEMMGRLIEIMRENGVTIDETKLDQIQKKLEEEGSYVVRLEID